MLYVFTSCALNFVPCAKLLAASVKTQMPNSRFVLVLTDARPDAFRLEDEGFDEVLYLEDFADQLDNPRGWAFGHDIMELATAIKPFTAAMLMEREDCDAVMFFDPDCVLFGKMTEMRAALSTHSVVLTPHASLMHENSDWLFFERNPLKVGGFNLGFFGLQNNHTGRAVASWWRFRLRDNCLLAPEEGLFTDQKWMDLLPCYTDDIKVMREPVYNIARWNTFQRRISKRVTRKTEKTTYLADSKPIEFVHFSGFYKVGPYVQGLYDNSSEPLIEDLTVLQELSVWYSEQLDAARSHPEYAEPWKLGYYGNGEEIPRSDRRRHKASPALQSRYPDPFAVTALDSFWLHCRQQDRIDDETRFQAVAPADVIIGESTLARNALLREQSQIYERQFAQMSGELEELRDRLTASEARVQQIEAGLLSALQNADKRRIHEIFGWTLDEKHFDPEMYLKHNPDVSESGMTPLEHFIRYGLAENRLGGGLEPNWVLHRYLDDLYRLVVREKAAAKRGRLRDIFGGPQPARGK